MCGFAGVLDPGNDSTDELGSQVTMMTRALSHRGPDAEGIWSKNGVALGHRRLSILDLSQAGSQPMHSVCGRYVIAFNGEIYNHMKLRFDLSMEGAAPEWRGHSDTETLLAGIAHWGLENTLRRCAGMFALGLLDRRSGRLSLARDRVGEKPLYWGWAGRAVIFGSELKALREHPDCPREICRQALAQYLRFAYVPAPYSIYRGIYKLEPGCVLSIDGNPPLAPPNEPLRPDTVYGSLSLLRYWSLSDFVDEGTQFPFKSDSEAVEAVEGALLRSVKRQMIADVPLGAFLSGGIDSSLIVSLMQAQSSRQVRTFTVGFESRTFNEAPFAAAVAQHLGTEHLELTVSENEAREVIPLLPDIYDEPFADSSQIPTFLLCKVAKANVTVALSGDAGDELFGGYNRYLWGPRIWRRFSLVPYPLRNSLARTIAAVPVGVWDLCGTLAGRNTSRPGEKVHRLATRLTGAKTIDDLYRGLVSQWTNEKLVNGLGETGHSMLDDPLPRSLVNDPAARMMMQDMRTYLPDDILCKVDRAAMAVGLETRVPFLDPDVLEASSRLQLNMKIRNGQGKWILRQILSQHIPCQLIERPKSGFAIPIGQWLRGPLRSWAEDLLSEEALRRDGLIDPAPVRLAWTEHLSGLRDRTNELWIVLMLLAWRASAS
jgi:asparagine synthase (glutamine-hydrolysing)